MSVDPLFAQWLQSAALTELVADAPTAVKWGELAVTTRRDTNLALQADAAAEGARQRNFRSQPIAVETHQIVGDGRQWLGQVITVTGDELGYGAGVDVFVIGADPDQSTGLSTLTVLRRL